MDVSTHVLAVPLEASEGARSAGAGVEMVVSYSMSAGDWIRGLRKKLLSHFSSPSFGIFNILDILAPYIFS